MKAMVEGGGVLTPREGEVLMLLAGGESEKSAARLLQVAPATIRRHRENLMQKLRARNTANLIALSAAAGLLRLSLCLLLAAMSCQTDQSGGRVPSGRLQVARVVRTGRNQLA